MASKNVLLDSKFAKSHNNSIYIQWQDNEFDVDWHRMSIRHSRHRISKVTNENIGQIVILCNMECQ